MMRPFPAKTLPLPEPVRHVLAEIAQVGTEVREVRGQMAELARADAAHPPVADAPGAGGAEESPAAEPEWSAPVPPAPAMAPATPAVDGPTPEPRPGPTAPSGDPSKGAVGIPPATAPTGLRLPSLDLVPLVQAMAAERAVVQETLQAFLALHRKQSADMAALRRELEALASRLNHRW